MNKKSALATAGALTASFVAGAAAVSFNWGLGTPASTAALATRAPATRALKPIVRHRTIVIHKASPASPSAAAPRTVVVSEPVAPVATVPPAATTSGSHAAGGGQTEGEGERGDD